MRLNFLTCSLFLVLGLYVAGFLDYYFETNSLFETEEPVMSINNKCDSPINIQFVDPFNTTYILLNGGESYNFTNEAIISPIELTFHDCGYSECEIDWYLDTMDYIRYQLNRFNYRIR